MMVAVDDSKNEHYQRIRFSYFTSRIMLSKIFLSYVFSPSKFEKEVLNYSLRIPITECIL